MPSWQDTIIIASGMVRDLKGQKVMACPIVNTATALSIYPHVDTGGQKAMLVWIRPTADVHFAVDVVATTISPDCAVLAADQEYIFPLHPEVNTISFLDAQSASNAVYVRWVYGR